MHKRISLLFLFLIFFNNCVYGQEDFDYMQESYVLEADRVSRIGENLYKAEGNVVLKARDLEFNADTLIYNSQTTEIDASGNVKITSPEQEFKAEKIKYNIQTETGSADNMKGFLAPFNYICAKSMKKTGPTTFTIVDAKISTCSGKVPDWSFSIHSGSMELGGYMHINHATANIKDTPFIYMPKFFYPVSTERQTGLLLPIIGYTTNMGAVGNFRYFIAPDVNYDFTLGVGLYSERGVQEQLEARFALSEESNFYIAGEHIKDFGSEANTQSRWRTTLKNQYSPFKNFYINVNADYVSDYLYMRDYEDYSISGFNKNNEQNMFFGEAKVKYYNDYAEAQILYRRDTGYRDIINGYRESSLELLPSVKVHQIVKDIPYVFFEYELGYDRVSSITKSYSNINNVITKTDDKWSVDRFSTYGRLYAPIDMKVLTFTPSLEIGYIHWLNSSTPFTFNSYTNPDFGGYYNVDGKSAYKYYGGAELNIAFKEIFRDFKNVRHSIQNNIVLNYVPDVDKFITETNNLTAPNMLWRDRTNYQGAVSYELINNLIGKDWSFMLKLSQGYDILKKENAVLPLKSLMTLRLFDYVTNTSEIYYKHSGPLEPGEKRFQYFTNTLMINIFKYFYFSGTYSYDTRLSVDTSQEIPPNTYNTTVKLAAGVNIWRFALEGFSDWWGYHENIGINKLVPYEYGGSVLYNAECWSMGLKASVSDYTVNAINNPYNRQEVKFYFMLSLKGLGDNSIEVFNLKNENPIQ